MRFVQSILTLMLYHQSDYQYPYSYRDSYCSHLLSQLNEILTVSIYYHIGPLMRDSHYTYLSFWKILTKILKVLIYYQIVIRDSDYHCLLLIQEMWPLCVGGTRRTLAIKPNFPRRQSISNQYCERNLRVETCGRLQRILQTKKSERERQREKCKITKLLVATVIYQGFLRKGYKTDN